MCRVPFLKLPTCIVHYLKTKKKLYVMDYNVQHYPVHARERFRKYLLLIYYKLHGYIYTCFTPLYVLIVRKVTHVKYVRECTATLQAVFTCTWSVHYQLPSSCYISTFPESSSGVVRFHTQIIK